MEYLMKYLLKPKPSRSSLWIALTDIKLLWFVLIILSARMAYLTSFGSNNDLPVKDAVILAIFCFFPTLEMWLYGSWFEEGPSARKEMNGWAGPLVASSVAMPLSIAVHILMTF